MRQIYHLWHHVGGVGKKIVVEGRFGMRLGEEYLLLGAMVVLEYVHPPSFPYLRGTSEK